MRRTRERWRFWYFPKHFIWNVKNGSKNFANQLDGKVVQHPCTLVLHRLDSRKERKRVNSEQKKIPTAVCLLVFGSELVYRNSHALIGPALSVISIHYAHGQGRIQTPWSTRSFHSCLMNHIRGVVSRKPNDDVIDNTNLSFWGTPWLWRLWCRFANVPTLVHI